MYLSKCIWQNDDHYHDCIVHALTIYDAVLFGNERTDERTNGRTNGRTDERTNGRTRLF